MDLLQDVLALASDALMIADNTGVLRQWSREAQKLFGPVAIEGTPLANVVHPEDRDTFNEAWRRVPESTTPVECASRLQNAPGQFSWRLQPSSDRRSVLASLRAAPSTPSPGSVEQQCSILQTLLNSLPLAVFAVDSAGTYTFHDGAAVETIGMKRGELVGQNLFESFWEDVSLKRALAGELNQSISLVHGIEFETWYCPVRDPQGNVTGVVGLSWNLTATKHIDVPKALFPVEQFRRQQEAIRELSTPVIQVWDRVLALPVIGTVDSQRTADIMERLLGDIVRLGAHYAILDLTGVDMVDTNAASHILNMIGAIRLLGAEAIITGIRPNVAQTMVSLGIDMSRMTTLADLRKGIEYCMKSLASTGTSSRGKKTETKGR